MRKDFYNDLIDKIIPAALKGTASKDLQFNPDHLVDTSG
jgi:hypothetical protein